MMDRLTAKVGPLPAWAWGLIVVVVAAVGYRYYTSRSGGAVDSATADSATLEGTDDAAADTGASADSGGYSSVPSDDDDSDAGAAPVGSTIVQPGQFTDDGEWSVYVAQHLQQAGAPAVTVSNALSDYLAGNRLTVAEAALIEAGVTAYGYPPGGVYPINVIPKATTSKSSGGTTKSPTTPTHHTPAAPGHVTAHATRPTVPPGAFALTQSSDTVLIASWQPVAGATKYQVSNAAGLTAATTTGTSATISGRTPGRQYGFKVRAGNGAGWGPYTAVHKHTMSKAGEIHSKIVPAR